MAVTVKTPRGPVQLTVSASGEVSLPETGEVLGALRKLPKGATTPWRAVYETAEGRTAGACKTRTEALLVILREYRIREAARVAAEAAAA